MHIKNSFVSDASDCRAKVLSTEEFLQKDVTLFPNPVTNELRIESLKNIDSIEIYNTLGKKILSTKNLKIDFSKFSNGIYLVKLICDKNTLVKRIIKN